MNEATFFAEKLDTDGRFNGRWSAFLRSLHLSDDRLIQRPRYDLALTTESHSSTPDVMRAAVAGGVLP